jgi:aspartate/methionine/tyrosine aminotransferase
MKLDSKRIAQRMHQIDSSGIRKVFDLAAKLENPIDLSIGQPDFDVPDDVKEAAVKALEGGFNRYTVTQGIPEFHSRLAECLKSSRGFEPEATVVTSGVSGALVLAILAVVDPGDEVVIPDPYFVMYPHLVRLAGGVPRFVDTYPDFRLVAERIEPVLSEHTKMVILNSPSNPTGVVATREESAEIAELARGRDFLVVSDEIYDAFCFDGPFASVATHLATTLVMGGFSKSHAMTGWRLGWAAGPGDVIAEMTKLQQYTFVCAPSFAQAAGVRAFDVDTSEQVSALKAKRDFMVEALRDEFEIAGGQGAFYLFPRAPWGTGDEFAGEAVSQGCLIIPGSVFSARDTHFRISYATSMEELERGAEFLVRLARRGPGSS